MRDSRLRTVFNPYPEIRGRDANFAAAHEIADDYVERLGYTPSEKWGVWHDVQRLFAQVDYLDREEIKGR